MGSFFRFMVMALLVWNFHMGAVQAAEEREEGEEFEGEQRPSLPTVSLEYFRGQQQKNKGGELVDKFNPCPNAASCPQSLTGQCPGFDYSCELQGVACNFVMGDTDCDGKYDVCLLCPDGTFPTDTDGDGCADSCCCDQSCAVQKSSRSVSVSVTDGKCSGCCPDPTGPRASSYLVGLKDDFQQPIDTSSPPNLEGQFDSLRADSPVAHLFRVRLPSRGSCILGATLNTRLKPVNGLCYNDGILLETTPEGATPRVSTYFRVNSNCRGPQDPAFDLSMDLSQYTSNSGVNLLESFRQTGTLKFRIQDDHAVDYLELVVQLGSSKFCRPVREQLQLVAVLNGNGGFSGVPTQIPQALECDCVLPPKTGCRETRKEVLVCGQTVVVRECLEPCIGRRARPVPVRGCPGALSVDTGVVPGSCFDPRVKYDGAVGVSLTSN